MSIWASREYVGHDDHEPMRGGDVRSYATGWSNHYPTTDGEVEQPASVGLAHIPTWCVPGHEESDDYDDFPLGPWVRLDVVTHDHENGKPVGGPWSHSVVMDEAAARQLAADLIEWADAPKVRPSKTEQDTARDRSKTMPIENRAIAEAQERVKTIDSQIEHEQEMQSTQRTALNRSIQRERDLQALKADWLAILEHDCATG